MVKSLDRFYVAMLPCPTMMLSRNMSLKYFNTIGMSPLIALQRVYSQAALVVLVSQEVCAS